jgi:hypothetical protein
MNKTMNSRLIHIAVLGIVAAILWPSTASAQFSYFSLTPCRVVDTRNAVSTNGGPALGTARRDFQIRGLCGVPTTAKAVTMNVTVTAASTGSWLTIWPSGGAMPVVSTINFDQTNWAIANGAIMGVSTNTLDVSVMNANGNVHLIIDITGYYQ